MSEFEAVIGLEVHAQLSTRSKMFCSCSAVFGGPPNTQVCPVCLGLPGALPVANRRALESAVLMGLATRCTIAPRSVFARKNYFYPDCPKNYQISQYDQPLCENGELRIDIAGDPRRIGITRIHLEEDAGKLLHDKSADHSLVDMNRVGVPLIEIVSEPDMRSPKEASRYVQKLRTLVRYLGIGDGNMEEGSLRCDVNVSLREKGTEVLGTKTEVKNLNSFRSVERALRFEIERQERILRDGGEVTHETLLWDAAKEEARIMRSKESAHDYRYFPEPDLLVLDAPESLVERVRSELPELPDARALRFVKDMKLPPYDAGVLTASRDVANYFEAVAVATRDAKVASNWVMGEVLRELKERKIDVTVFKVSPGQLASLITGLGAGKVNMTSAKEVFREMAESGRDPHEIIAEKGLEQIRDDSAIELVVTKVLDGHPDEVQKYFDGKEKLFKFLVGQVMKESRGKADPQKAAALLEKALASRRG